MGCTESVTPEEKHSQNRSKEIDRELDRRKKQLNKEIKLLLLGPGASGKSTFAKQFKILFITGFNDEEKKSYIPQLFSNILTGMISLIELAEKRGFEFEDTKSKQDLLNFEPIRSDTPREEIIKLTNLTKKLWQENAIRKALEDGFGIPDSIEYIVGRIDEMLKEGYSPSNQDILRCRMKTTGAYETSFAIQNIPIRMVDVGGQRSERRKWIHFFDDVKSLVFCIALNSYDQVLEEDEKTNGMIESLNLFKGITETKYFRSTHIILFLNKKDVFEKRIKEKNITTCFPEYTGPQENDAAVNYIKEKFKEQAQGREFFPHATCATDTNNIKVVWSVVKNIILGDVIEQF